MKVKVLKEGCKIEKEEIKFFKEAKPLILGKLIYYNKLYRIETSCPVSRGNFSHQHYSREIKELKIILSSMCPIQSFTIITVQEEPIQMKIFRIELGDTHHAFHRMKNRTESRTIFLDNLKSQLEQYME